MESNKKVSILNKQVKKIYKRSVRNEVRKEMTELKDAYIVGKTKINK